MDLAEDAVGDGDAFGLTTSSRTNLDSFGGSFVLRFVSHAARIPSFVTAPARTRTRAPTGASTSHGE